MSNGPAPSVKTGPPAWLWIIMVPLTIAILVGVVISSLPADPQEIYDNAKALVDQKADRAEIETQLARLASFPEYEAKLTYLQARVEANQQRDVKAIALFRQALEQSNDDQLNARIQYGLAASLRNAGEFYPAIEAYEASIALNPEEAVSAQLELANLYAGAGAYKLCEDLTSQMLDRDESQRKARELRGTIKAEMLRFEDALSDLEMLLATPGDRAAASPALIKAATECLIRLGDEEAIKKFVTDCAGLIEDDEQKTRLAMAMGDYSSLKDMIDTGRLPEAQDTLLRAAVTYGNDEFELASELAVRACQNMPRQREVLLLAEKIFKAAGNDENLKVVQANISQFEETEKAISEAFAKAGDSIDDFDARLKLAELFVQIGDYAQAQRWFATAAMVKPARASELTEPSAAMFQRPSMFVEFPKPKNSAEDESKTDEPKEDEPKEDEPKTDEPKTEESKTDEPKTEEAKTDEPKTEESKTEESKTEESKTEESKTEESKTEESKTEESKTEESKTEESKTEESKTEESKTEESKTEESKADEPKADEPKAEEAE